MKLLEKKISSELIYSTSFLELYEDEVLLPNNKTSKRIYATHLGAAAVLPLTKDNKVVLTKQFRYPIRAINIEIPAGKKDFKDEAGIDCVKRELEEETNYTSNNIQPLLSIHSCVGYSDEVIELFIAYDCEYVKDIRSSDEDEFVEAVLYELDEVVEMIENGAITDAKTIIAVQSYLLKK
jgi:ADP-ribose pyrophosphatase